jgi:hypothetical protein
MLKTKIDFQKINNKCQSVIDSYDIFSDIALWLEEHKSLFNQINIQPKGLPGICNSNFEGIKYEYISKFHSLYEKTDYEWNILDHIPHDIAIMYFFEQMNTYMLGHYLTEECYMGKDQPDFFYSIGNAFQELQNRGNTKLIAQEMYCPSLDKMEYYFMGNKENSYLHLMFKLENKKVIDLIECRELKPNLPIDIDPEKQVFLNTELPSL